MVEESVESKRIHTYYIVEHFEQELSEWTLSEYLHILLIINKLYHKIILPEANTPPQVPLETLIVTNFPFPAQLSRGTLEEDDLHTKKNTETLMQIKGKSVFKDKVLFSEKSFQELTTSSTDLQPCQHDDTQMVGNLLRSQIATTLDNICFMDMRAEETLKPADVQQFQFVVFGGILGDHPPQDRAKDFREKFSHIRKLGEVQMTTDTALLVSHEILNQKKAYESLAFTDDPSIPMEDTVMHFLDNALPINMLASMPDNQVTDFPFQIIKSHLQPQAKQFIETQSEITKMVKMMGQQNAAQQDANVEMSTIMEGFRYRVNDSPYPVAKEGKVLDDFPVIPIGMLKIWRDQNEEDDFNFK